MKQSQTSLLRRANEFLTAALRSAKKFLSPMLRRAIEAMKPAARQAKEFLSTKNGKLVALIAVLILVLIIGLTRCSKTETPSTELPIGTIASDILEVHKKPKANSRILGILPLDLEVEILEEKTVKETTWGRIDETMLPNGKTVESGWIDLQFVDFTDDSDVPVAEDIPADEPKAPPVTVNMATITANKLNIRKAPGSDSDTNGAYYEGDRVEILETQTVEDTVWGRTNLGWVGMGYVRMDGPPAFEGRDDISAIKSDGNTTVLGYGTADLRELNVRLGPDTNYAKVRTITKRVRYAYYQEENGWVRLEDGWVSTEHFYREGTVLDEIITGTATTNGLNVRSGPDTSFRVLTTLNEGDPVAVLAQVDGWGYTEQGWLSMDYVEIDKPVYSTGSGTVINGLNIRQEANAESDIVGTYTTGDRVEILEVMENWGRTDQGWINLAYVEYDTADAAFAASTVPASTTP